MLNCEGFTVLQNSISVHATHIKAATTPIVDEEKRFLSLASGRLEPLTEHLLGLCKLIYRRINRLSHVCEPEVPRQNIAKLADPHGRGVSVDWWKLSLRLLADLIC